MTASPIPHCPELHAVVITDLAVHLILWIDPPWEGQREAAVAELESKTQAATAYAASADYKARYGTRIPVLRVQSATVAPSIVAHLLTEQGIELEHLPPAEPGAAPPRPPSLTTPPADLPPGSAEPLTCSFCHRAGLSTAQTQMTDSGWACPSCFRAWTIKTQPQILEKPRQLRIPPKLIVPLVVLIAVLFAVWLYSELHRMNGMNSLIRQHLPRE